MLHPHFTLPGGAGRTVLEVGKRLAANHKVIVIAQQIDPIIVRDWPMIEFISLQAPLTSQFSFWLLWFVWYAKTARQLNRLRRHYTITVYCGVFPAQWFGLLYGRLHPAVPCVWYCHEPSAFIHVPMWRQSIISPVKRLLANILSPLLSVIDKWMALQAKTIFVHTPYNADLVAKVYRRSAVVAPPGVTLSAYQPIPFNQKKRIILAVGRLTQFKRYDILVRAFAQLNDATVQLCLVGDGEAKSELQQLICSLGIEQRASILSGINDEALRQLYAQALVLVSCARAEPYGLTVLEAQASGTAVIIDNSGGTRYIVDHQKTGLAIDCTEANLVAALRQVLEDKTVLETWSRAARQGVATRFSWDNTAAIIRPFVQPLPEAIAIIHPHFTLPGGAGRVALELGTRLAKNRRVVVITQRITGEWEKRFANMEFISLNGPLTSQWSFWLTWPWWYYKTAQQLNRLRPHFTVTIFNNVFPAHWFGLLYSYLHPAVRSVWYCHEPSAFIYSATWRAAIPSRSKRWLSLLLRPLLMALDRHLVKYAQHIFTNSQTTAAVIRRVYQRSSTVVYPGVDPSMYQSISPEQKRNVILTVGRLTAFKRLPILLEAFAQAAPPEYLLQIVGDGEERAALQKRIQTLHLQERVNILTHVSDRELRQYYAQAKLFVLCSKHEPFGIVITEALMSGTPVIADNSGGPTEIVRSGQNGELINCTVTDLTAVLHRLLRQPNALNRYAQQARPLTEQRFSWDVAAQQLLQHL